MLRVSKFRIHFLGAPYSNELYDGYGCCIYNLDEAIDIAMNMYPDCAWEVYNGIQGFTYKPFRLSEE